MKRTVCIYCGARSGSSPSIFHQSRILAEDLARMGFDLVYGGGKDGLMGMVADIFLKEGRNVIGVRPGKLIKDEDVHAKLSQVEVVSDMYVRKARMIELADVLIALTGGTGTLDEIMDAISEIKLGFVDKWLGVLNVQGYYDLFKGQLDRMVDHEFLRLEDRQLIHFADNPQEMLTLLQNKYPNQNEIDKLAYLHFENGQILTTLSKGKSSYYIPGGKRDNGESDHQALIREIKEELTVATEPESIQYMGTYRAQADGKPKGTIVKMTCYSAEYQGTLRADNEIAEIRWMNYSDRDKVSHVDKLIFDDLWEKGVLK